MKKVIRCAAFLILLAFVAIFLSKLMTNGGEYANYQRLHGFFEEPENSLDAVFLGSSATYAYWDGPIAWGNYGIAAYPLASSRQPFAAAEYLIRAARKTQPHALYLVPLNNLDCDFSVPQLHQTLDYFPASLEKLRLTKALLDYGGYAPKDRLEFYFPLYRYHTRWNELTEIDFTYELDGLKGGTSTGAFLRRSADVSGMYRHTEKREALPGYTQDALEKLLDYCDKEKVNALFFVSPLCRVDESVLAQINTALDIVAQRGYPTLDLRDKAGEIGLDPEREYYNENHTNVHGAVKVTKYICEYLIEEYGFEDKRGDPAYAGWNQAYLDYIDVIDDSCCDFEWECSPRDLSLEAPKMNAVKTAGTTLRISWRAVEGAQGYCVYRKSAQEGFTRVADVGADQTGFDDVNRAPGEEYTYVAVSYREENGVRLWGKYDLAGVSASAALDAPKNFAASGEWNNLALTWDPVEGAEGYMVFRRLFGKSWVELADVGLETSYTDNAMLEDMPYQYTVRAYLINPDDESEPFYGAVSEVNLYVTDVPAPEVTGTLTDGVPVLTWKTVEGVSNYTVFRRAEGEENWSKPAGLLDADCVRFADITAEKGVRYEYRVRANLACNNELKGKFYSNTVVLTAQADPMPLGEMRVLFCRQVGKNIRLVWKMSSKASYYNVYRRAEGSDLWTEVAAGQTGNSCQDKPPADGRYFYAVQVVREEDGYSFSGPYGEDAGAAVEFVVKK